MAIDLGALTGAANNAASRTATTSKTSDETGADFSRTLAASRASRDRGAEAQKSDKPMPNGKAEHETTRADDPDRAAKNADHSQSPPRDTASNPAGTKTTAPDSDTGEHVDLVCRRLSPVSLLAAHTQTASNDKGETVDDKSHDASKPTDMTGPIATLIPAPLIATQMLNPGSGSQTTVGNATSGRSSASPATTPWHASWSQLFARLDGDAGNTPSNSQAHSRAGGDSPAQLLAALAANNKTDAHAAGDTGGTSRFQILPADNSQPGNQNTSPLPGMAGHGPNTTAAAAQTSSTGAATAPASASLSAPLASDEWNHALGQQTLRLVGSGQQQARIQLHPRELGPINIAVTVNDHNQAQVHFAAAHAHTRDAVEAALPQLRQALATGGLSLGQTSVGDQNSQAAFAGGDDPPNQRARQPAGEVAPVTDTALDAGAVAPVSRGPAQIGGIHIFA